MYKSAAIIWVVVQLTWSVYADMIASAQLQTCLQSSTELSCRQRLVASFTIAGNQAISLQASLSGAATSSSNPTMKNLVTPYTISIKRSMPYLQYPLYYFRDYNSKPVEKQVYVPDVIIPQCKDGDLEDHPTCGWVYDSKGTRIPYSQGFCCSCSLAQLIGATKTNSRANLNCQLFSTLYSSGSCMSYDPLWYSAYEVGPATKVFDIQVTITNQGSIISKLSVSPVSPSAIDSVTGVKISLTGDFSGYTLPYTFESKYVFIPSKPVTNIRVQNVQQYTMIIDKSFTGTESQCDVIGTGYKAFKLQSNGCSALPNSCLQNQIEHFYTQDVARIKAGQGPSFLLPAYGSPVISPGNDTSSPYSLRFYLTSSGSSLLNVEMSADNLKFVSTVSPGNILNAMVDPFVSLSRSGNMILTVKNTGTIDAGYTIIVKECSPNILPITALKVDISAGVTFLVKIAINTDTALETSNQCTVYLMDAGDVQQDTKTVYFTATNQVTMVPETANDQSGVTKENKPADTSGCAFYNVICIVQQQQWKQLGTIIGVIAALIISIIIVVVVLILCAHPVSRSFLCGFCKCLLVIFSSCPSIVDWFENTSPKKRKKRAKVQKKKQRFEEKEKRRRERDDPRFTSSESDTSSSSSDSEYDTYEDNVYYDREERRAWKQNVKEEEEKQKREMQRKVLLKKRRATSKKKKQQPKNLD
jgi:hypothetical protein